MADVIFDRFVGKSVNGDFYVFDALRHLVDELAKLLENLGQCYGSIPTAGRARPFGTNACPETPEASHRYCVIRIG